MKLYKLFMGITAAAMFAACSSDDAIVAENPLAGAFDAQGNGYVKVALNLPTAPASRAIGDPGDGYGEFNDGEKYEYTVENAILCLFDDGGSTNELDYTLVSAWDLASGEWNDNTATQITSTRQFVREISNAGVTGGLHAYVILNKHSFFTLEGNTLKFNAQCPEPGHDTWTVCNGMTLADFGQLTLREQGRRYDGNSFLMTNMPYATAPGGAKNPHELGAPEVHNLYPLAGAIYSTEAAAQNPANPAAEINVERVLAKVETTLNSGIQTTEHNHYKFQFLGWYIDNTNPNTYIGRHTRDLNAGAGHYYDYFEYNQNDANNYRMVSQYPVSAQQPDRFRTFWAFDPNYDVRADVAGHDQLVTASGDVVDNRLMKYDAAGNNIGGRLRASGSHYYCTENTFDVAHQSVSNTTRIIVAAQFLDGSDNPMDFYTIDRESDKMYTLAQIESYTKDRIADRSSVITWAHDYLADPDKAKDYVKVNVATPTKSGVVTVTVDPLTAADIADADLLDPSEKAAAVTAFNKNITPAPGVTTHDEYLAEFVVNYYKEGVSYYQALIQHFGEHETPWDKAAHAGQSNETTKIYDTLDENMYLGRYGVVRNNWYKIDVTGVRQIGSAVVPPVPGKDPLDPTDPDTPDDTVESFLKVRVNIMPWAIRKQSTVL